MKKVVSVSKSIKFADKLRGEKSKIVLVGGVFDILHVGHVRFLEKARQEGDSLFLLLESDESVRKLKGKNRPINNQKERGEVLAGLSSVDVIINLKGILKDEDYDRIVQQIKPNVLATTKSDYYVFHKERQAKLVGAKVKTVINRFNKKSTTKLLENE